MSKTNTRNNRGIGATLTRVAHSINNWFEDMCSFSDSSNADAVIKGIAQLRNQYTQEREARPVLTD